MSWQLGSFTLLALAITGGFAWYERERPDARIVALVGTLAAFAALGRIAFAALPNVKPTTDIVLISGYALGGGPGFAVGALAGLSSNFFFGQGPWTPWQMAAWGVTGFLGALLAWAMTAHRRWRRGGQRSIHGLGRGAGEPAPMRRRRRRATSSGRGPRAPAPIGRWPLALVCGAAGFAFTVVQDVGDWVTYSDHSWTQLGVYVGKGLGFDTVHAVGCVVFALALGPALNRSIGRFARRLQVTWVGPGVAAPVIALALALSLPSGLGIPGLARAAVSPISYLRAAENADGGFGAAPHQPSASLYSGWAALGLASAGEDLQRTGASRSLLSYIRTAPGSLGDVGSLERTILVVRAAGLSARRFGGHDLVAALKRRFRHDGSVAGQVNLTAFAVLALRAAGLHPGARTMNWLARQQNRDGGFSFAGVGSSSDVDDSGAALEALARQPGVAGVRDRAVAYLRHHQDRDGGFPQQAGAGSNAQSTAWAVQGLDAVKVPAASVHRNGSASPLAYLHSLIAPDGHVRYARGVNQTPVWVTGQAIMALAGKPLPLAAPFAVGRARTAVRRSSRRSSPSRPSSSSASPSSSGSPSSASSAVATTASAAPPNQPFAVHSTRAPRSAAAAAAGAGPADSAAIAGWASATGLLTAVVLAPIDLA